MSINYTEKLSSHFAGIEKHAITRLIWSRLWIKYVKTVQVSTNEIISHLYHAIGNFQLAKSIITGHA